MAAATAASTAAAIPAAAAAVTGSVSIWVSPRLFSRVSLLLCSDTILKAINNNPRLTWKPENREKNHDTLVFIIFLMNKNNRYKGSINRVQ